MFPQTLLSTNQITTVVTPFLLVLHLALIPEIQAFRCYVCDSKNNIECMEKLPADSRLNSQDCKNITGAKYCIKTTNVYAGELGTKRFCAANDHGNQCKYIRQPTGDREYRSCIYTCNSENCNSAMWTLNSLTILYILTPLTILANIVLSQSSMTILNL